MEREGLILAYRVQSIIGEARAGARGKSLTPELWKGATYLFAPYWLAHPTFLYKLGPPAQR